jgi:hypothetical protein
MRGLANEEMGATMARTPLADVLQRATAEAAAQERRVSRRDALKLGGAFGLAAAAAAIPFQAGQAATVYEASDRVGGRSWTLRGAFADG